MATPSRFSTVISPLAPDPVLKASYRKMLSMKQSMIDFNNNLDFSSRLSQLTGRARDIALDIERTVVPKVRTHGQNTLNAMQIVTSNIQRFSQHMITACDELTQHRSAALIQVRLAVVSQDIEGLQNTLSQLRAAMDSYHTDISDLIGDLNAENDEISREDQQLAAESQQIIDRINSRTETVCGVIRTVIDALTFQLQEELLSETQELSRIRAQYRSNTAAMLSMNNMKSGVGNFLGQIEQQQTFWDKLGIHIGNLAGDIQELLDDPGDWEFEVEAVKDDWSTVQSIS